MAEATKRLGELEFSIRGKLTRCTEYKPDDSDITYLTGYVAIMGATHKVRPADDTIWHQMKANADSVVEIRGTITDKMGLVAMLVIPQK